MKRDYLYFILNPALGIIKIGIAADVNVRRGQLECGCGVPLQVLRSVEGGADYEVLLHDAFGPSRLMGEWFAPSDELLALARGTETLERFTTRKAAEIREWSMAREQRMAARRAENAAAAKVERDEMSRLRAEEKRLKAERKAKALAASKKVEAAAAVRADRERERVTLEHAAWQHAAPELVAKVVAPAAAAETSKRLALIGQRERNAAMIGRGAIAP